MTIQFEQQKIQEFKTMEPSVGDAIESVELSLSKDGHLKFQDHLHFE